MHELPANGLSANYGKSRAHVAMLVMELYGDVAINNVTAVRISASPYNAINTDRKRITALTCRFYRHCCRCAHRRRCCYRSCRCSRRCSRRSAATDAIPPLWLLLRQLPVMKLRDAKFSSYRQKYVAGWVANKSFSHQSLPV